MPSQRPLSGTTAIRPLLRRLGLDDREVEVYLALLPMKIARASRVASAAKQTRSHTYLVLRSLEQKGLVSEIERGKVLHFIAEPPQRLLGYIEDREEELHSLKPLVSGALPFLQSLTSPLVGKPRVTMLTGLDGMRQVYRDILREEFSAFFNPEVMYKAFDGNMMHQLFGKHFTFHGRDLLVHTDATELYLSEMDEQIGEDYSIRILPKGLQFGTDTIIYGDTVALLAYDDEKTIVRIENQNIANSFRAWFETLWGISKQARL